MLQKYVYVASYIYCVKLILHFVIILQIAEELVDVINKNYTFPLPNSNLLIPASSATILGLSHHEPSGNVTCCVYTF